MEATEQQWREAVRETAAQIIRETAEEQEGQH